MGHAECGCIAGFDSVGGGECVDHYAGADFAQCAGGAAYL